MTNSKKIQKALELIKEVQVDVGEDTLLQMFIEEDITRLEQLAQWIKH